MFDALKSKTVEGMAREALTAWVNLQKQDAIWLRFACK
jgi:hypothetical protein